MPRPQFSLQALLVVMAVVAVCCAVSTWLPEEARATVGTVLVFAIPIVALLAGCEWLKEKQRRE